jgi:hypothetical protein
MKQVVFALAMLAVICAVTISAMANHCVPVRSIIDGDGSELVCQFVRELNGMCLDGCYYPEEHPRN